MQILEHQDERAPRRDLVEEPQPRGVVLLRLGLGRFESKQRAQPLADAAVIRPVLHDALEQSGRRLRIVRLEDPGVGLHHLAERPERPRLPVGHAAPVPPGDELTAGIDEGEQLVHQTSLADAGVADDQRDLGGARVDDPAQQADEERELAVTADQRRQVPRRRERPGASDRLLRQPPGQRPGTSP